MTLRDEAMALVSLLPNPAKYSLKLEAMLAAKQEADATIAAAKAAENSSAERIAVAETVLASLNEQADALKSAQEAAEGKLASAEADLARRLGELEAAKVAHAAAVADSLAIFTAREQEISLKQSAMDAHIAAHTKILHEGQAGLHARNLELRQIIGAARQGLATAS
jgi:chromosome segregation ATPase